jgi:YfiH family protein
MTLPPVPDTFYWTSSACGIVLRCRALDPVAPHVFTTRQLSLSSDEDWGRVAEAVGARRVATLDQVHGREVVAITGDSPSPARRPVGDALVSNDAAMAVAVRTADCVPLLLADAATGAVAAVHAGWRGTVARVAIAAIEALQRSFGVNATNVVVAIGPSIAACCYPVGQNVRDAFLAGGDVEPERWFSNGRLDLVAANRDQLMMAGVLETQIHACGLCTAMHLDVLTSYRAEKEKAGRLVAAIRGRTYNPA